MIVLDNYLQNVESGGIHTAPEIRATMALLARNMHAQRILELGYDAGYTLLAFAQMCPAAEIVGVDDQSEYPLVKAGAVELLKDYSNIELITESAIKFITDCPDNYFDFIFVDDNHGYDHVNVEMQQLLRIIKLGGYLLFHDVVYYTYIWDLIQKHFTKQECIRLPGFVTHSGKDMGFGLVHIITKE